MTLFTLGLYIHISGPFFRVPFPWSLGGDRMVKMLSFWPLVQALMVMTRCQVRPVDGHLHLTDRGLAPHVIEAALNYGLGVFGQGVACSAQKQGQGQGNIKQRSFRHYVLLGTRDLLYGGSHFYEPPPQKDINSLKKFQKR